MLQFARFTEREPWPIERGRASYAAAWREEFSRPHDPSGLRAESNVLRYRPVRRVVARHAGGQDTALARLRTAAEVTGVELVEVDARSVGDADFVARLRPDDRVRLLAEHDEHDGTLVRALVAAGGWFDTAPPSPHGRVELTKWVREQAVSRTLHRHGRLANERTAG